MQAMIFRKVWLGSKTAQLFRDVTHTHTNADTVYSEELCKIVKSMAGQGTDRVNEQLEESENHQI